ncbi:MAG: magnesium transporter MgtE N-terminal domain-containing protein, partial [Acidimicrobiales bacterium]
LHLSSVTKSPLVDRSGEKLGRVADLIVRLGDVGYPPISGLLATIGKRDLFVPIDLVQSIEPGKVTLKGETLNLRRFERRPNELLLARDLSARHLINLVGARLIKANEIELACIDGTWRVAGVDPSARPVLRRILPRAQARQVKPGQILDWSSIEPFVSHVPSAQLRIPYRKLARLHPAQIADLVEEASHDEGEEIIEAVGHDSALEADVFEELDTDHQLEFLRSRSDAEVAALMANMAPDDAADLLVDLDQQRRQPVLDLMPPTRRRKVKTLLSYNPGTAGGLMNPEFVCVPEATPASQVFEIVGGNDSLPETLSMVYSMDDHGRVSGSASILKLLRSNGPTPVRHLVEPEPVVLSPDADLHEVVRKMTDYNLINVPVVDSDKRMIGVVTVDDVLESMLPEGWRREFGMAAGE